DLTVSTVSKTVSRIISASLLGSLAGIVTFTVAPQVASAADEGGDNALVLQEVTVTANKLTATKVLDIPTSIQAISGDARNSKAIFRIMDVARRITPLS